MLRTRPIRSPRQPDDGVRISIMSRHTLPDGKTPDTTINPTMYDQWQPVFAPPPRVVGSYYRQEIDWQRFTKLYLQYLGTIEQDIRELINQAKQGHVTLLCTEDTPHHCHRRLLAEYCQRLDDTIETIIK